MDIEESIKLSCAPFWAHPDMKHLAESNPSKPLPNVIPWRDHWMQAVYYLPKPLTLQTGDSFILNSNHDEYSLWFDVFHAKSDIKQSVPRHECSCSMHMTYSRSRIGQLNQSQRNKRFIRYLEDNVKKDSNVLVLGDGSLLGLSCSRLGAKKVLCHEPHRYSRHFMEKMVEHNQLKNVKFIEKLDDIKEDIETIDLVFAEPYFLTSILPWDNFFFGSLLMKIIKNLPKSSKISPSAARIYCVPVEFLDLNKIRTPIKECEGFDLKIFDDMVEVR